MPTTSEILDVPGYERYAEQAGEITQKFHELCIEASEVMRERPEMPEIPDDGFLSDTATSALSLLLSLDLIIHAPAMIKNPSDEFLEVWSLKMTELDQVVGMFAVAMSVLARTQGGGILDTPLSSF